MKKGASRKVAKKVPAAKPAKRMAPARKVAKADAAAAIPAEFAPLVSAFTEDRQVTVVRNFGSVGLRVCGKAFAMVVEGKLVAKLPKHRVDELLGSRKAEPFQMGQRLMKEWVAVAPTAAPWMEVATEAYRFVKSSTT
jgi:hypothetical protein